jgi:methylenetetrahydrofolate dehydrogenase (NADP+) / methenyltetrahydrofolate cyclohydrolase
MTAKILYAAPVVQHIKNDLILRCEALKKSGVIPSMCVVLVGNNPASLSYIKNKKKMCEEIGAHFQLEHMLSDISVEEFSKRIHQLNNDKSINGIIIQLPVPEHLKHLNIPNIIAPSKDIDGFHGLNTQKLYEGTKDLSLLLPCTPKGIVRLLQFYGIDPSGKNIVISGRSLIVGKPLSMLLSNFNATVVLAHSQTKNLKDFTRKADIVISAIGKAHYFDHTFFDSTKNSIVIDVGMNVLNGKLAGDINFQNVLDKVGAITPVPGGVGPMTVICLIENLISATEQQMKGKI